MFDALSAHDHAQIRNLWATACSVSISLRLVSAASPHGGLPDLLGLVLQTASEKAWHVEMPWWDFADSLDKLVAMTAGQGRSVRKDHVRVMELGLQFCGKPVTHYMVHAAALCKAVLVPETKQKLMDLTFQYGYGLLAGHCCKLQLLCAACKRWATDRLTASEVATFAIDQLAYYLETGAAKDGPDFFKKAAFDVKPCRECEQAGVACEACGTGGRSCWLRVVMEKIRIRSWIVESIVQEASVPAHRKEEISRSMRQDSIARDANPPACLQPWLAFVRGDHDQALAKGAGEVLRQTALAAMLATLALAGEASSKGGSANQRVPDGEERVEASQLLEKAKTHVDSHLLWLPAPLSRGDEGRLDFLDRALSECQKPGQLNEQHRLFVLQAELLFETSSLPWTSYGSLKWSRAQRKHFEDVLKWAKSSAAGRGDMLLVTDGGDYKVRRVVEDCLNVIKLPRPCGHAGDSVGKGERGPPWARGVCRTTPALLRPSLLRLASGPCCLRAEGGSLRACFHNLNQRGAGGGFELATDDREGQGGNGELQSAEARGVELQWCPISLA